MCLLWVLLQFVVMAMHWDVPVISVTDGETVILEMKHKEEEELPLMDSDEETSLTYRAVSADPLDTSTSSETPPRQDASTVSKPFKKFSAGKGE